MLTALKSSVVLQISAMLRAVKKLPYDYCCVDLHKENAKWNPRMYRSKEGWIIQSSISVCGVTPSLMQIVGKAALPVDLNTQEIFLLQMPLFLFHQADQLISAPPHACNIQRQWVNECHGIFDLIMDRGITKFKFICRVRFWMDTPLITLSVSILVRASCIIFITLGDDRLFLILYLFWWKHNFLFFSGILSCGWHKSIVLYLPSFAIFMVIN